MNKVSPLTWLLLTISITLATPANAREYQDNSKRTDNLQLASASAPQAYAEIWEQEAKPSVINTFDEISEQLHKRINQQLETVISGMLNDILKDQIH